MSASRSLLKTVKQGIYVYTTKIKFTIVLSFFSLMAFACFSVIFYAHKQFSTELSSMMDEQVDTIVYATARRIFNFLEPIQEITQATSWMVDAPEDITTEKKRMARHLMGLLEAFPQIERFTIGTQNGSFLGVTRVCRGDVYRFRSNHFLMPKTAYRVTFVDRDQSPVMEEDTYYDHRGDWLDTDLNASLHDPHLSASQLESLYDPRSRPWYQASQKTGKTVWSKPYVYANSTELGVSVSSPIYSKTGKYIGTTSTDININELSNFLKAQSLGPIETIFLFTPTGELVAYPDNEQMIHFSSCGLQMTKLDALSNLNIQTFYQKYKERAFEKKFVFHANQGPYEDFGYIVEMPDTLHTTWKVGLIVLGDKFLSNMEKIIKQSLTFGVVILLLALILMLFISKKISTPIEAVAKDLKRIQNLEFEQKFQCQSQFSEISDMLEALKHVVSVLQAFGQFVPKTLVKQLIWTGRGAQLGGEQKNLTVMFTDIQNFTSISETMHSERLLLHLSDYFEEMTEMIKKDHGTLDKYIGDSIMAFWGAPLPDAQHAYRTCHSALACVNRIEALNETWKALDRPSMVTRFGIATGQMLVGNIGSSDRLQYTVLGDIVNLAARLEQLNKEYGTRILVSEATYIPTQDRFIFRPVDRVAVKGKENGVQIYELLGEISKTATYPIPAYIELSNLTTQAYQSYSQGQWEDALNRYQSIHALFPDDSLTAVFIKRCQTFLENPPGDDWDFVTRFGGRAS